MRLPKTYGLNQAYLLLLAHSALASHRAEAGSEGEGRLPVPKRELEWGDANFLAISDTHGTPSPLR